MTGFTFDSPISHSASAYDKANRRKSNAFDLPSDKARKTSPLLGQLKRKFGGSGLLSSAVRTESIPPTPARESRFFRLPLAVRQKIYGYIVGQGELLHVMLRFRSAPSRWRVAYRRCRAGGNVENCVLKDCKQFHDFVKGSYFGYFDHVGGLFRTCRDIYKEASHVLYNQNTLEFDHPRSLIILSGDIPSTSLQSIRSISIDLQRHFYVYGSDNFKLCPSLHPDQWHQMWNIISTMQGLEEVRVSFRLLIDGWMGWTEDEVLEPLYRVRQPLKAFEVEMPASSGKSNVKDDDLEMERKKEPPFQLIRY